MGKELVFEIGTEEIPAGFLNYAIEDLHSITESVLNENLLDFSDISAFGTPRRLALHVTELAEKQSDETQEIFGPPTRIAFDQDGNPTKAALGFAKSQGVPWDQIKRIKRDKGEFLAVVKKQKGQKTQKLLPDLLKKITLSIPFRKSMKWGSGDTPFVRPIRWLLATYGGKTVSFSIEEVRSSNKSRGHRFLYPKPFKTSSWEDYAQELVKRNIMLDQNERMRFIETNIEKESGKYRGHIERDPDLLETVTNLVEYPVVLSGGFEPEFLELPKEVLVSVMKNHQKYFPLYSNDSYDQLLANFVFVSGTPVDESSIVIKGNERVIRARFSDARFFYHEDRAQKLESKLEELKGMVFLSGFGTYYDKSQRLGAIAERLAAELGMDRESKDIKRAAYLCKADLSTQMVFEFPELEGVMGRYYALASGENENIANAIYEHYMPTAREGELPGSDSGAVVSLADKFDNIATCFAAGLLPTGTQDPYALRRQAIGIINIALDKEYRLNIPWIVKTCLDLVWQNHKESAKEPVDNIAAQINDFITDRFRNLMTTQGYAQDVVEAILSCDSTDLVDARDKIIALTSFKGEEDFEPLAVAFKRVVNIVKNEECHKTQEQLFKETIEKELYQALKNTRDSVTQLIEDKNYSESLTAMRELKEPVDRFFDNILVMDKDPQIKQNRLALLWEIRDVFFNIADFSKLST